MNEEDLQRIERGDPSSFGEVVLLVGLAVGVIAMLSFIVAVIT